MTKSPVKKVFGILSFPVHCIHLLCNRVFPHSKNSGHLVIGIIVAVLGSFVASIHTEVIPHYYVESLGGAIHATGVTPVVSAVLRFFKVEF